jgi:tetratricopeptide (TPR) repeat protein
VDGDRPTPHRFAARIYEDMGAFSLAAEAAEREAGLAPQEAAAWERVGRLRLRLGDRAAARAAYERARQAGPTVEGLLDLALLHQLEGDLGAEVSACEQATRIDPGSAVAWGRLAHALARTSRVSEAVAACERALGLAEDEEVRDLLARLREIEAQALPQRTAA